MNSATDFAAFRRRRTPMAGSFFIPSNLSTIALVQTLATLSRDLVTTYSSPVTPFPFQRKNARLLILKVKILLSLFEFLSDASALPRSSATLCFKEFYILIYRARLLLDYCAESSRLWLLLQNQQISGSFHDLNQEISTILDVFPFWEMDLPCELEEQLVLLQKQARRAKLYVDGEDELVRMRVFEFLDGFGRGRLPEREEVKIMLVDRLGIGSARSCRLAVDFIEEQIVNSEEGDANCPSVMGGVVAFIRYCRFLLFGFVEDGQDFDGGSEKKPKRRASSVGSGDFTIPKDFCCPISLDLMKDPVTVSTGQTYDRSSITQWIEEGRSTCPNSGQILAHTQLVPNITLRSLISQWCASHGIHYDLPEGSGSSLENMAAASSSRAAVEANRATTRILLKKLDDGSEVDEVTVAARELRLLAKTGKENRCLIAEAGAIPLLKKLLNSTNPITQENSVTAILNLSIHDKNKIRIMEEEEGCLRAIVSVLRHGHTTEARENAAATLFSLSAVHDYKKRITDEPKAVEALARLLRHGSERGKKDAVTALFNLSTHPESCSIMIESGAVLALVQALAMDGVAEEAAGALALLIRKQGVAEVVAKDDSVVKNLVGLLRRGSPKAKENAVAALCELCKSGGVELIQRVARTPALGGLIQRLLFTGTKRAKRKAASLARMCQKPEVVAGMENGVGRGVEYVITRSNSIRRNSEGFVGGDTVSVSVTVSVL